MRISTKGRYSLAALLYMATRHEGRCANTKEIAAAAGTSEGYVEQLFIPLRRLGVVEGARGRNGGYALARPPRRINIGEVLRACEGSLKPALCVDARRCPEEARCRSRHTWAALYRAVNACLDAITLADLAKDYDAHEEPGYMI